MLRVRGVNQRLTWPFSARQAKQLFTLYKKSPACMIPACDLTIKNDVAWDELLEDDIFPRIEEELVPEGPFEAILSHLHIDGNGTTAKLLPTTRAKGSFGTLCIVLLSEHVGGDIHVTHGRHTQEVYTGDELYASFVAFYNATTLTVSPMDHGRRVMLVYDLVYMEDHASRDAPPSLAAVSASLASLAKIPRQYYANLAYRCTHQYMLLDFEMLLGVDIAFVQAVADTDAYDIAFCGARKKPFHGDLQTMSEEELARDRAIAEDPNALMRVTTSDFYPACHTPPVVKACLRARPLGPVVGAIYSESLHIVVWPKQHRVRILGWTKAIEHLKLLVKQATSDLLGYTSVDAFALATIEMLGTTDRKDDPKDVDVPNPLDVLPLLRALDSRDVTATFIAEFMDLRR
ncbi:hypothetical protein SPRG_18983 [Saprolegnia parasitica CBS 223.65]|uniref:Uncharacterized protein n=1 Tax=Saprolegnia parasitica (strain CBS 223.65) TaxID=695850 RepID=A0A067CU50_SAPPC|nr:hypothetical protein SPRG_18983 [Saprolegnia parasitica CBS 223.65]KDO34048.1 hypothetical protein SPRG_18983 [Saprolegnia parasitica CBS 223.65]|eukprot:XP_012195193.1 hypothetical protein SPRG_18983 [Saprolegnia parasitica CBS 223.65]